MPSKLSASPRLISLSRMRSVSSTNIALHLLWLDAGTSLRRLALLLLKLRYPSGDITLFALILDLSERLDRLVELEQSRVSLRDAVDRAAMRFRVCGLRGQTPVDLQGLHV